MKKIGIVAALMSTAPLHTQAAPHYISTQELVPTTHRPVPAGAATYQKEFIRDAQSELVDPAQIHLYESAGKPERTRYDLHMTHATKKHTCARIPLQSQLIGPIPPDMMHVATLTKTNIKLYARKRDIEAGYINCVTPHSSPITESPSTDSRT